MSNSSLCLRCVWSTQAPNLHWLFSKALNTNLWALLYIDWRIEGLLWQALHRVSLIIHSPCTLN